MGQIKVLKFLGGISTEINTSLDDIVAKTFVVGGPSGTILTKAILDNLSSGSADASSLHNHDTQYFRKTEFIVSSTGSIDASKPVKTDGRGKLDPSFYQTSDLTHGDLSGLNADDHIQYLNNTRGDARYYQKTEFIQTSAGAGDAGKPIAANGNGKLDPSFTDVTGSDHNDLQGLQGGATDDYFHLQQSDYDTLRGGSSDASMLHHHDGRYYTKTQVDDSLDVKADDADVIKKDGSVAFTAAQSMGGFKLTNLDDGSSSSDAVNFGQLSNVESAKVNKAGDTMSGNLDMDGNEVIGLPSTPSTGTAAVSKNYVDNLLAGQAWRKPVRAIDTVNSTLPTGTTVDIDGVTVVNGDRILFTNLISTSNNNRVFKVSGVGTSLAWTLEVDGQAGTGAPTDGDALLVQEGGTYEDSQFTFNGTTWVQTSGAGQIQAGVGLSKSGNTLDVNLGAGIAQLPSDAIGVDVFTNGGLGLVDPVTGDPSSATDAQLAVLVDDNTIERQAGGLAVKDSGIIESKLSPDSVSTSKIQDSAVEESKIADNAVTTNKIADSAVDSNKIADGSVVATKLNSDVAGAGIELDGSTNAISVSVDNSTIVLNGSDQIEVADDAISTEKIQNSAVTPEKIAFGPSPDGVNASTIPYDNYDDTINQSSNVSEALLEIGHAVYAEVAVAGESIGQDELVVIRRDASNARKVYRASAVATDNYVPGTLVIEDLTYTAVTPSGNNIRVRYIDPAVINAAISVSVSNSDISVSLATNGSGAITSTATQIKAAIDGNVTAAGLVSVAITGTGSTIQSAHSFENLTGGMDYNDNGRWEAFGIARGAAVLDDPIVIQKIGSMTATWETAPTANDIGKTVYISINRGKASLAPPTATNAAIVVIGRYEGSDKVSFKPSVLRGVIG